MPLKHGAVFYELLILSLIPNTKTLEMYIDKPIAHHGEDVAMWCADEHTDDDVLNFEVVYHNSTGFLRKLILWTSQSDYSDCRYHNCDPVNANSKGLYNGTVYKTSVQCSDSEKVYRCSNGHEFKSQTLRVFNKHHGIVIAPRLEQCPFPVMPSLCTNSCYSIYGEENVTVTERGEPIMLQCSGMLIHDLDQPTTYTWYRSYANGKMEIISHGVVPLPDGFPVDEDRTANYMGSAGVCAYRYWTPINLWYQTDKDESEIIHITCKVEVKSGDHTLETMFAYQTVCLVNPTPAPPMHSQFLGEPEDDDDIRTVVIVNAELDPIHLVDLNVMEVVNDDEENENDNNKNSPESEDEEDKEETYHVEYDYAYIYEN